MRSRPLAQLTLTSFSARCKSAVHSGFGVELQTPSRPQRRSRMLKPTTNNAPTFKLARRSASRLCANGGFDVSRISSRRRCSSLLLTHGKSPSEVPVSTSGLQAENVERPAYTLPNTLSSGSSIATNTESAPQTSVKDCSPATMRSSAVVSEILCRSTATLVHVRSRPGSRRPLTARRVVDLSVSDSAISKRLPPGGRT